MTGPVTVFVFVCLVLFCFWLLETITRFLSICLCYPSFAWCTHRIILVYAFSFMDVCLCFVIWCVILLTRGVFSLAHCGLEAWPIMEDVEPISLGSEIWPREFETVTHLLMIRAVPCSLPALWLCFDLHPSLWALHSITLWDHYMTFPSSVFPSLSHPLSDSTR